MKCYEAMNGTNQLAAIKFSIISFRQIDLLIQFGGQQTNRLLSIAEFQMSYALFMVNCGVTSGHCVMLVCQFDTKRRYGTPGYRSWHNDNVTQLAASIFNIIILFPFFSRIPHILYIYKYI